MKYFILAGGYGRRAEPLSRFKPKPAFPLAGTPLLELLLDQLQGLGCGEGFVNLHHLGAQVATAAGGRPGLRWIEESELSGSRVLRQAQPFVCDWLLAVNGDTFLEIPLAAMVGEARDPAVDGVLAARPDPSGRYARLRCADGFFLESEAASGPSQPGGLMYAGAALFRRRALERIDGDNFFSSIGEHGLRFRVVPYGGIWLDIGTPLSYFNANWEYLEHLRSPMTNAVSPGVAISPHARVQRSVLWEGARLGAGVLMAECIVTAGVEVGPGDYRRQILTPQGAFPLA